MTDPSPTAAPTQEVQGGPGLRFRTAYRRAEQAPTVAAAYQMMLAADPQQDQGRMLLAIARRPDLNAATLNRIADNHDLRNHDQWVLAMFAANKRIARTKAARQFITRDVLPLLLTDPDGIEEILVREVVSIHLGDSKAQEYAALARQSIGAEKVAAIVAGIVADEATRQDVASSYLLDDAGWDTLLATLPKTKKAAKEQARDLTQARLIETLLRRPDLTDERSAALLKALGTGMDSVWRLMSLLRNPHCPKALFLMAASGKDKQLADTALASEHCPDEARFAAVMVGRPYAIIKARTPIPVAVAHRALDDARTVRARAAGRAGWGQDPDLGEVNEASVVDQVTRYTNDPDVMQRCLDHHLSRTGMSKAEALASFYNNLLHRHSRHFHACVAVEPRDHAMDFLAGNPDGDVRALVVPDVGPEEFDAVKADPSEAVRVALVHRLAADGSNDYQWVRTDPSVRVRMTLAAHEDAVPAGWVPLVDDLDEEIVAVVGERILAGLAHGADLPALGG